MVIPHLRPLVIIFPLLTTLFNTLHTVMFVRGRSTFITKTSITPDSGITSLVLIPLPNPQESVEDVGPHLNGSLLGSAILNLVPHEAKVRRKESPSHQKLIRVAPRP